MKISLISVILFAILSTAFSQIAAIPSDLSESRSIDENHRRDDERGNSDGRGGGRGNGHSDHGNGHGNGHDKHDDQPAVIPEPSVYGTFAAGFLFSFIILRRRQKNLIYCL